MRNLTIVLAAGIALSGCAYSRMPELGQYQAEYVSASSAELVEGVVFTRPGKADDLPECIAATVSNQGETLSDSSGSFVGAYTGNYYNVQRSTNTAGGSVIEYASPDGRSVVASGLTRYNANALVARSVRFKLSVKQGESGRIYRYGNLGQAQLNTGSVANNGYNPIGAWAGANPNLALDSLSRLTDNIERCLSR